MADNTQVQTQLTALRTLQQSYDAIATASASGATAAALENAKQAILDAIAAIDVSDLAKETTLGAYTDLSSAHTVFGHITKLQEILDLVDDHVGSDTLTLNEKLDIIRTVIGEISLVPNSDNVGNGNQAWTLVLNQSLAVNNETIEQS